MGSYDDIINLRHPDPTGRPRMDMAERAKIFLPFAALKGHEEAIAERTLQHIEEQEHFIESWDESEDSSDKEFWGD